LWGPNAKFNKILTFVLPIRETLFTIYGKEGRKTKKIEEIARKEFRHFRVLYALVSL